MLLEELLEGLRLLLGDYSLQFITETCCTVSVDLVHNGGLVVPHQFENFLGTVQLRPIVPALYAPLGQGVGDFYPVVPVDCEEGVGYFMVEIDSPSGFFAVAPPA